MAEPAAASNAAGSGGDAGKDIDWTADELQALDNPRVNDLWKLQIHPQLGNNSVNTSTTLQTQSTGGANPSHPLCICKLIPTVRKCIPGTDTLQTHPQCGTLANAVCVCKSRRILQNHPLHFFCKPIPVWRSTCKTGPNRKYQPQGAVNFANLYPVG